MTIYEVGLRVYMPNLPFIAYLYGEDTVLEFADQGDANKYREYLLGLQQAGKYPAEFEVYVMGVELYAPGAIDVEDMKRKDALAKLTSDEIKMLGITVNSDME